MRNDLTGRWGEETAAAYLRRRHYTIVAANYRCRLGEIDLIAEDGRYLAFVEVKLRKSGAFAPARAFVDRRKQEKLRITAECWLAEHPAGGLQPRFDVAEVYAPRGLGTERPQIQYVLNAF